MKYGRVIDISRYKASIEQHGKEYQESQDISSRQPLFRKAVGQTGCQCKSAYNAGCGQDKGHSIGFDYHGAAGCEYPLISVGTPLFRQKRVSIL